MTSKKHEAARFHILAWFRQLFNVKKMPFSTNESLGDASANRTPRPHWKPAALTDGLISVYSPLSFSEVPWQHVNVLMGICIFLWLLPVTANQLKRSKRLNKYSGLFTEYRERSDGWVINVYLLDPSYGDFVWSHEGWLYLLAQDLQGISVRPEMRSMERYRACLKASRLCVF